jgi:hypothetical protein
MSKKKPTRLTPIPKSKVEALSQRLECDEGWEKLRKRLPEGLDTLAVQRGAVQRWRKLRSAGDLVRLALLYGFASLGLYTLVAWAARAGLVRFSAEALGYRLSRSPRFLGQLLGCALQSQGAVPTLRGVPRIVRILLNDASVLTLPGGTGTDLRLHTHFELPQQRLSAVRVSGPELGERLDRLEATAGTLEIGDMGLGRASGLHARAQCGVWTLTRVHFQNLRLESQPAVPIDIAQILKRADRGEGSTSVLVPLAGHEPLQARLLVRPLRPEAAARARQKLLKNASKKSKAPDALALELAGYLCLLTTAPQEMLSDDDAFRLYRLRWQIELAFKPPEQLCAEELPTSWRPEPSLWRLTHLASLAMFGFLAGPSQWWYRSSSDDATLLGERKRRRRTAHHEIVTLAEKLRTPQVNEFILKVG